MKKVTWIIGSLIAVVVTIFLAGIYKFNYLSSKEGYDMDGNKIKIKGNDVTGNYVTSDYQKRNEGYDWVAVSAVNLTDSTMSISIRSRIDKKKPSCTYDAVATKISESVYKSIEDGKGILYIFNNNTLVISAENKNPKEVILSYPCSGGASLANTYLKINEPLDKTQIDPSIFTKTLNWQSMGYRVTSIIEKGYLQLLIEPFGFENNDIIKVQLDGSIENAEIEDLDFDDYPEVLVYVSPSKNSTIHKVIGFSPNNGKSFSQITFPVVSDNPKLKIGYNGFDEYAIVENTFVQKFKLFEMKGNTPYETGKIRQIEYKLESGETSKKFVIENITEN